MARQSLLPTLFDRDRDPFTSLRKEMNDIFESWMVGSTAVPALASNGEKFFAPQLDVSETDKEFKVSVDLPGIAEKDVDVKLVGNQLTIRGEKKAEHEEKEGSEKEKGRYYHRIERSYGMFQRTLTVPFDVGTEKVDATFKNGVLTVTIQKPATMQQAARKIEVRTAA